MEEKTLLHAVLVFPKKGEEVLLAIKGKKIGVGCWNGYGGGIEPDEEMIQAAIRELFEESGGVVAKAEDLERVAVVDFYNTKSDGSSFICKVHVFLLSKWEGEFAETEEMLRPTWFPISSLPFEHMMLADPPWVRAVMGGKKIIAEAYYGPFQKTLLKSVIVKEVANLD